MKKCLVTGGAGYIGCVMVRQLLDKGYTVRVIDSLKWGGESLFDLINNNDFELFADSLSQEKLKVIIKSSFGNKYEKIPKYIANFKKLIKLLNSF